MNDISRSTPVEKEQSERDSATRGRINQSVLYWCYEKYYSLEEICRIAQQLGCKALELIAPKDWPLLQQLSLIHI